jgi:hypothetical protein
MIRRPLPFLLARTAVVAFVILSAGYCLLAYIPFTYHQVYLGGLLPWLTAFAKYHNYLYWPTFLLALLTLPDSTNGRVRVHGVLFVLVFGALGVYLLRYPLLTNLQNDVDSAFFALAALIPLPWMAWLDWLGQGQNIAWVNPEAGDAPRVFRACLLTAAYVSLLASVLFVLRYAMTRSAFDHWAFAILCSVADHVIVFMAIFLVLTFAESLGKLLQRAAVTNILYAGAAIAFLTLVLHSVVFAPISFTGPLAAVVAVATASCIFAFAFGIGVRLYRTEDGALHSPLGLYFAPLRFVRSIPLRWKFVFAVGCSVALSYALLKASKLDWEYLVQTLLVMLLWTAAFGIFYITAPAPRKRTSNVYLIVASMVVSMYFGALVAESRAAGKTNGALAQLGTSLDDYADYDVAFRLVHGLLAPRVSVASDDTLYDFLAGNTNIPRSTRTEPVDVNLVSQLTPGAGPKPNIFVFVIDSLRRDYLSPYNSSVSFTPAIDAFARESVVVPNAFTRYAGTGLSEPSIWSGAMLLHKQYVTPFYPMNSLQKLIDAEGYRQFVTKDEILSTILAPSASLTALDENRPTMDCNLCQTLSELQAKLAATQSDSRPVFVYTQPQDLHVSVINRDGRSVPGGGSYPGFDPAYAARLRRLDNCFGQFIAFLKQTGMYDDSVIVLTADHGDSLGEHGRWGHAYNVVPEVVRVPLIVHLPAEARGLSLEQDSPAFLTDITPSLYYLLGQHPIEHNALFGRPLFTASGDEARSYARDSYLIASSYGPVYGLLQDQGQSLYVIDGVAYKDYAYRWNGSGYASSSISAQQRWSDQQTIRSLVNEIARFYHFSGGGS